MTHARSNGAGEVPQTEYGEESWDEENKEEEGQ